MPGLTTARRRPRIQARSPPPPRKGGSTPRDRRESDPAPGLRAARTLSEERRAVERGGARRDRGRGHTTDEAPRIQAPSRPQPRPHAELSGPMPRRSRTREALFFPPRAPRITQARRCDCPARRRAADRARRTLLAARAASRQTEP